MTLIQHFDEDAIFNLVKAVATVIICFNKESGMATMQRRLLYVTGFAKMCIVHTFMNI